MFVLVLAFRMDSLHLYLLSAGLQLPLGASKHRNKSDFVITVTMSQTEEILAIFVSKSLKPESGKNISNCSPSMTFSAI